MGAFTLKYDDRILGFHFEHRNISATDSFSFDFFLKTCFQMQLCFFFPSLFCISFSRTSFDMAQNGVFGQDCFVQWLNAQNLEEESSGLNPSFGLVGHVTLNVLLELSVPQFLCS